jgi:chromosome segregation ATPase
MDDGSTAQWLTYEEAGERLRVSVAAVRARALRGGWRRQPGNDGKARVLITQEAVRAAAEQPSSPRAKPAKRDLVGVLRAHVDTLKADVARLEGELVCAQARADKATAGLADSEARTALAQTKADQAIDELFEVTQRLAITETQLASERERADWATERFTGLAQQLADVAAAYAKGELATPQAKPWWRRWLGAA